MYSNQGRRDRSYPPCIGRPCNCWTGLLLDAICPGYVEISMTAKNPQVMEAVDECLTTSVPMQCTGRAKGLLTGSFTQLEEETLF
ncbi:hypothetical protein K504DRAFT_517793 [Pleomassaria siparia CBS 279.74]|uniref:Uncharacterized protein n=1 Tax=Pleomassaria siparia CBS 279.74 TaxID=1314801 RepID=A0A6G1KMK1_9PLEO|nr:hypothetical protein K504DRAFT_517793 [Pleomassaria siparia CBS 279.74]